MIDPAKKYRTRDGREVRIYAVDAGGERPVHGAARERNHAWEVKSWNADGTYLSRHQALDLFEIKPRIQREVWVNVYCDYQTVHSNLEAAQLNARIGRIACVKLMIDCEEGEGL